MNVSRGAPDGKLLLAARDLTPERARSAPIPEAIIENEMFSRNRCMDYLALLRYLDSWPNLMVIKSHQN